MLFAATHHGLLRMNLAGAQTTTQLLFPKHGATSVATDPSGRRVAVGMRLPEALIVDTSTWRPRGGPLPHDERVTDVAFSPDGKSLATASVDRMARIWHTLSSTYRYCVCLPHPVTVTNVEFSPDGRWLATTCIDGRIRLCPIPAPPASIEDAARRTRQVTGARLNEDEQVEAIPWQTWQTSKR